MCFFLYFSHISVHYVELSEFSPSYCICFNLFSLTLFPLNVLRLSYLAVRLKGGRGERRRKRRAGLPLEGDTYNDSHISGRRRRERKEGREGEKEGKWEK